MSLFEVHAYPPLLLLGPEHLASGRIRSTYLILFSCGVPPVQITFLIDPFTKDIEVEMMKRVFREIRLKAQRRVVWPLADNRGLPFLTRGVTRMQTIARRGRHRQHRLFANQISRRTVKLSWKAMTLEETWQHYVQQSPAADWMPQSPTGASPLLADWPTRGIIPLADGVQYQCYLLLEQSLPPLQLTVQMRSEEVTATACWPLLAQTLQEVLAGLSLQEGAHQLEQPEPGRNIYWLPLLGRFDAQEGCAFGPPTYATVVKPLGRDSLLILSGATGDEQGIVPTYLCYTSNDAWCRGEPDFSWDQVAEGALAHIVWQRQEFLRLYTGVDLGSVARDGRDVYFQHVNDFQQQALSDWHDHPSRFVASATGDFPKSDIAES